MVTTAALGVSVFLLLELGARTLAAARWGSRGIHGLPVSAPALLMAAAVAGLLAAIWGSQAGVAAAAAVASSAWLGFVAIRTDSASRKIPAGACWVAFAGGVVIAVSAVPTRVVLVEVGLAVLVAAVSAFAGARYGLGGGDARFLMALTPLSAFTSATFFALGILASAVIQLGYRIAYRIPRGTRLPFAAALTAGMLSVMTAAVVTGDALPL